MGELMPKNGATILVVSDDAELRARTRREMATRRVGVRVAAVSNLDAAWRVVQDTSPDVIVLEDVSPGAQPEDPLGRGPRLKTTVSSLATYAPVVVICAPERRGDLSALVSAGAADYVERSEGCFPLALEHIERRLERSFSMEQNLSAPLAVASEDFGEVLRHELNNPLTGILGNAELLLAEIRRKNDGKLPRGGQQRVETIAALAVRLRETVRRLSQEWRARQTDSPPAGPAQDDATPGDATSAGAAQADLS
jgi:signal transduction histidine kinase